MKIAITGTMGSGKSSVTKYLKSKGYHVEDMDEWVANMYKDKAILDEIGTLLNIGRNITKDDVRQVVFNDEKALKVLESYIHPKVYDKLNDYSDELLFVEVPLLFETGGENKFDYVVCVGSDDDIRYDRLVKKGFDKKSIEYRNSLQLSNEEKIRRSDFVVYNNTTLESLYKEVDEVLKQIVKEN